MSTSALLRTSQVGICSYEQFCTAPDLTGRHLFNHGGDCVTPGFMMAASVYCCWGQLFMLGTTCSRFPGLTMNSTECMDAELTAVMLAANACMASM